jgi:hypothetical protein
MSDRKSVFYVDVGSLTPEQAEDMVRSTRKLAGIDLARPGLDEAEQKPFDSAAFVKHLSAASKEVEAALKLYYGAGKYGRTADDLNECVRVLSRLSRDFAPKK